MGLVSQVNPIQLLIVGHCCLRTSKTHAQIFSSMCFRSVQKTCPTTGYCPAIGGFTLVALDLVTLSSEIDSLSQGLTPYSVRRGRDGCVLTGLL